MADGEDAGLGAEAQEPTGVRQLGLERALGRKDADERGLSVAVCEDAQQNTDAQEVRVWELAVAGAVGALPRKLVAHAWSRT